MNVATARDLAESSCVPETPAFGNDPAGANWDAFAPGDGWESADRSRPTRPGLSPLRSVAFAVVATVVGLAANIASASSTTETTAPPETETTQSETTTPTSTDSPSPEAPADDGTETTVAEEPPASETTAPGDDTPTEETSTTAAPAPAPAPATEEERQKIKDAEAAKAREVDAANARLGVVTEALATLRQNVETQQAEVEIATQALATAEARLNAVNEDVIELERMVADLELGLSDQAIRSFKGELLDMAVIEVGSDPNQVIRMQAMLAKATESDIDYVNELAGVKETLLGRRADVERAAMVAEESRQASQAQLAELEQDQQAQLELAGAAEDRLDHLLTERATLARLGADYESGGAEEALVAQLSKTPAAPQPATSTAPTSTITDADIRSAGKGIEVHKDIVEDIRRLLADAAADGVDLAGGGYRDPAAQIRTRRANCGTSNYAIYEMRSSQCRPPTARPGRSMHEQGKAIDFTYNGALIRSRSGRGWEWLKANAAKYGLFNLPSEAWHWSTNGR